MSSNDNERRAMLALLLSITVYFVWMNFYAPAPVAAPALAPIAATAADPLATPSAPSVPSATVPPTASVVVPDHQLALQTPSLAGEIHSSDGALRRTSLSDYLHGPRVMPLYTWILQKFGGAPGGWQPYTSDNVAYEVLSSQGALLLAGAGSLSPGTGYQLTSGEGGLIRATHSDPGGLTIIKEYRPVLAPGGTEALSSDPYLLDIRVTFINNGPQPIGDLWVGVADILPVESGQFQDGMRPLAHVDGGLEHYSDLTDLDGPEQELVAAPPSWFGLGDRYFMSVLLPGADSGLQRLVVDGLADGRYGAFAFSTLSVAGGGGQQTLSLRAYVGPKKLDILETINPDMAAAVELGWFGFFARILLWLLKIFQAGVINWGASILLLTLFVKLVFYPLTQRSFVSSRKMQKIQPQLQEIREKYKDNQQLMSQETMKLFSENGVNPLGGCLPMLIQLPVWIALYNVMLYSVELYNSQFLYLKDLTAQDPYGVLPVIYALLIFGQQKMMPMPNMDPAQQRVMQLMPLLFAVFMFTFPSGLVLYFCCNILLTIGQQWLINQTIKIDAPANG